MTFPFSGHGFPMAEFLQAKPREPVLSELQVRILAYLKKVESDGVARVTYDELAAATSASPGVAGRSLKSLARRGIVDIATVRATFVRLKDGVR